MRTQHVTAFIDAIERDDHDEDSAGLEPAEELFEEELFHALPAALADLEIVRWVEVERWSDFYMSKYEEMRPVLT